MGNLAQSANRYMDEVITESVVNEMGIERHIGLNDEEGGLEKELAIAISGGEELGGEEGVEEDEIEMISLEDAKAAIQLVIDGEVDDVEEAIARVSTSDDEDVDGVDGVDGDELGDDEVEEVEEGCGKKKHLEETDEEELPVEEIGEEDEKLYGESHSKFLKFSERYL